MKIVKLKLSEICINDSTQARKLDQNEVIKYAEQMKEGDKFPPIVVFGKKNWLGDGFHRYHAYKMNGVLEVECEQHEGTARDAFLYGIGANNLRGLSMKPEENRDNIMRLLQDEEWGKWSDEKIAKTVGVPRSTVYRIRKKLEESGEIEKKASTKYVNKHGKESEMAAPQKAKEPEPDPKPVDDDVVLELTHTIDEISRENEVLKEKIALGQWDASEIEKLDVQEMLESLREENRLLKLENKTLRESRDTYQYENAQLIKTVKSLKAKLKKAGVE